MSDRSFRVLTLNAGLLDITLFGKHLLEPAPYVDERLAALPRLLLRQNADVIALQEVYQQEHREHLIERLKERYPHHFYRREHRAFRLDNSLLFFSKLPFTSVRAVPFANGILEEDFATFMGLLEATVRPAGFGEVTLYNLHATAGGARDQWSPSVEAVRAKQIGQVIRSVRHARLRSAKIILGDINAGPEVSSVNYTLFADNGFIDAYAAKHVTSSKMTWDPHTALNRQGPHRHCPPQRIDHVFVREQDLRTLGVRSARIVLDTPSVPVGRGRNVTPSDHYGVTVAFEPSRS